MAINIPENTSLAPIENTGLEDLSMSSLNKDAENSLMPSSQIGRASCRERV